MNLPSRRLCKKRTEEHHLKFWNGITAATMVWSCKTTRPPEQRRHGRFASNLLLIQAVVAARSGSEEVAAAAAKPEAHGWVPAIMRQACGTFVSKKMRSPDNKIASTVTMGKPVCRLAAHRAKRREAPVHCTTGTGGQSSRGNPTIGGGGGGRRNGRVCDSCIEEEDDGDESAPSESSDCVSRFTAAASGFVGCADIVGGGGLGLLADGVEVGDGPGGPVGEVTSVFALSADSFVGTGSALLPFPRSSNDEPA